jgi:hypothetical protein
MAESPRSSSSSSGSTISSGIGSLFPSRTRRRRNSPPEELPTLVPAERPSKAVLLLPTEEEPMARAGAKAAHQGVSKQAYFPTGAWRPTALQKARTDMVFVSGKGPPMAGLDRFPPPIFHHPLWVKGP